MVFVASSRASWSEANLSSQQVEPPK
jgi:hypothetical protein